MRDNAVKARNVAVTWLPQVSEGENGRRERAGTGQNPSFPAVSCLAHDIVAETMAGAMMERVVTHHRSLFFMSNFPVIKPLFGASVDALSATGGDSTRAL